MKKTILLLGLIAVFSLLLVACTPQKQANKENPTIEKSTITEDKTTIKEESVTTSVSKDNLDQLKAEIEKIEAEDLGGLSNS